MRRFNATIFVVVVVFNVVCVIDVVGSLNCESTNAEGPKKNAPCVFPFTYRGKTYHECTNVADPEGKFW